MLIQSGAGYQEKNGAFNEGDITGLDWAIAPVGVASDFEFRFSRHASYATDGTPVFTGDIFGFLLESENTGFVTEDTAPDSGAFAYTFSTSSPGPRLTITLDQGNVTISWPGTGKLQSRRSLGADSWQDVPNASSGFTVPAAELETYYRVQE